MCETKIAKKLRLGRNFPRTSLCSKKNSVGIGLIKPKIVVAILARKLHIENLTANTKISKTIQMQEESLTI